MWFDSNSNLPLKSFEPYFERFSEFAPRSLRDKLFKKRQTEAPWYFR
jgi:hypothetical protein